MGGPLPMRRLRSAAQSAFRTPAMYSENWLKTSLRTTSALNSAGCHLPDGNVWYSQKLPSSSVMSSMVAMHSKSGGGLPWP
eukprot:7169715-Prymnesium_polylepis.2